MCKSVQMALASIFDIKYITVELEDANMKDSKRKISWINVLAVSHSTIIIFTLTITVSFIPTETKIQLARGSPFLLRLPETSGKVGQEIILLEIERSYSITKSYTFSVPEVTLACSCECEGDVDYEHNNFATAQKSGPNFLYSTSGPLSNCNYKMDCGVNLKDFKGERFKAIRIGQLETTYKIAVSAPNQKTLNVYEVPDSVIRFATDDGTVIEIASTVYHHHLPEGWYYYPHDRKELFSLAPMNNPEEHNIKKLGWFRMTSADYSLSESVTSQLRKSLSVNVTACLSNSTLFSWDLDAVHFYDHGFLRKQVGKSAQDIYGSIFKHIEIRKSLLTLLYQNELPVWVNITSSQHGEFMFWPEISVDQFSNRALKLTLRGVRGTVLGSIGSDIISVVVSQNEPILTQATVRLSSSINTAQWICLHPEGKLEDRLCRWAKIHEDTLHEASADKSPLFEVADTFKKTNGEESGKDANIGTVIASVVAAAVIILVLVTAAAFIAKKIKHVHGSRIGIVKGTKEQQQCL